MFIEDKQIQPSNGQRGCWLLLVWHTRSCTNATKDEHEMMSDHHDQTCDCSVNRLQCNHWQQCFWSISGEEDKPGASLNHPPGRCCQHPTSSFRFGEDLIAKIASLEPLDEICCSPKPLETTEFWKRWVRGWQAADLVRGFHATSVQNTPLARGHQQASQHLFVSNFLVSSLAPPVPPKTTEFTREIATRRRAQIREPIT